MSALEDHLKNRTAAGDDGAVSQTAAASEFQGRVAIDRCLAALSIGPGKRGCGGGHAGVREGHRAGLDQAASATEDTRVSQDAGRGAAGGNQPSGTHDRAIAEAVVILGAAGPHEHREAVAKATELQARSITNGKAEACPR